MPSPAPAHWPERQPASLADEAFARAIGDFDFEGMERALENGANPNRPIKARFASLSGAITAHAPYQWFFDDCSGRQRASGLSAEAFAAEHARLARLMIQHGANFSLPSFYGENATAADRASAVWGSSSLSLDSLAAYAQGGGRMDIFFSENDFCGSLRQGARSLNDPQTLERLWEECGLKERVAALGGRTTLLTRLLGQAQLEGALWLAEKGVRPAPLREDHSGADGGQGFNALHLIGSYAAFYCRGPGDAKTGGYWSDAYGVTQERLIACSRLAAELGEDPNALCARGATPLQRAFLRRGKRDFRVVIAWAREMASLGAHNVPSAAGAGLLAFACADPQAAQEQMSVALDLGADPKADGPRAALALLKKSGPSDDKAAALALRRLIELGANPAEAPTAAEEASGQAWCARGALFACLKELYAAGAPPSWRAPSGATVASIACAKQGSAGGRASDIVLALAIERGAPLDGLGPDGMAPLHHAAKALDHKKCAALLAAGADPNALSADGAAPLRLAGARHGARLNAPMEKTLAAFALDPRVNWGAADKKGLSIFDALAKRASPAALDIAARAARQDPGFELSPKAAKALRERSDGAMESVERLLLERAVHAPGPASRARKKAL